MLNKQKLLKLYQNAYEFEHQRKDVFNSRLGFPLTVMMIVVGAIVYLLNNSDFSELSWKKTIMLILMIPAIIAAGVAFYFLIRCIYKYTYRYVANTLLIDDYLNKVQIYNEKASDKIDINVELDELLIEQYRDCAAANNLNNKRKSGYFVRTIISIIISVIFIVLSYVPFLVDKITKTPKPLDVNIENVLEVRNMSNDDKPENQTQPEQPEKPVRPPTDDITEADVPKKDIRTKKIDGCSD